MRGFTLIELLIVIAITAILIGGMVPILGITQGDARSTKLISDFDAIKVASTLLFINTGQWPHGNNNSAGDGLVNNLGQGASPILDWDGPYLDVWKKDPWGTNYMIVDYGEDPVIVFVSSCGPNGICLECPGPDSDCDDIFSTIVMNPRNR